MKLQVKNTSDERTLMYVKKDVLMRLKTQAPQIGFTSMAKYLEALSNLPARKIKSILN